MADHGITTGITALAVFARSEEQGGKIQLKATTGLAASLGRRVDLLIDGSNESVRGFEAAVAQELRAEKVS